MLVLSTKPFHKLTGADGQADRRTGKHMCWEAAPPKIHLEKNDFEELHLFGLCFPLFEGGEWKGHMGIGINTSSKLIQQRNQKNICGG